ncbi:MAG: GspE/PulE family protein [Minisyncoccia bacterium]
MKENKVRNELEQGVNVSIIALIDALIEEAQSMRASDIHIDPREKDLQIRMRIDGVLQDAHSFPKNIQSEVVSRIKVLAGLRTDEHQTPQDGRFRVILDDKGPVDVRVSIAPVYYGENVVMRLLAERSDKLSLDVLGLSESDQKKIETAIRKPYGMILATGPTGSGKTTTLYTILKTLNTREVSVITIEDPIEYAIEGINQIQANPTAGLTFANGLRSVLRQDPDIIMVGEIRDSETANLAVNTALTGHLMLSTLHTSDAATTLPRLLDLGLEPYLITTTVNIVIGQRLVRKICENCKKPRKVTANEQSNIAKDLGIEVGAIPDTLYRGEGCDECLNSGYRGRVGIYEVMVIDDEIREAMLEKHSAANIKRMATERGMSTMVEDGFNKAKAGETTVEEVLRVMHE